MTFIVPSEITFCLDRVKLYDMIQVVDGPMKGRMGHVCDIGKNGYLTIKEVFRRTSELLSEVSIIMFFIHVCSPQTDPFIVRTWHIP